MRSRLTARWQTVGVVLSVAVMLSLAPPARGATITWRGHTWNVTNGGMAGVCQGNPANIAVDSSGYLHMKITNSGGTWTAAEIFSTDKLGFGTYQWQIEGPTDKLDKNAVVGLFPYGPEAGLGQSGNNEIDIEFARWGNSAWPNGNYTVWPPTGSTTGEHTFDFSLNGGTLLTTRFVWSNTKIDFATLSGLVAVDGTSGLIDSWSFAPANPTTRITQEAMPLGMNLWCYDNPPSDGQNVEIVVRDFQFVPQGALVDGGAGGTGGAGGDGGGGARGTGGRDGSAGTDATTGKGGASGTGGAGAGTGGAARGGATGAGGMATGGAGAAAGTGGSATGGVGPVAGSRGSATGGSVGADASAGTGGVGTGGARSDAPPGTTSSGGAAGSAGGSAGVASGSGGTSTGGAAGSGGISRSGGATGASGTAGRADTGQAGCSCRIAGARTAPGGCVMLLAVAWLLLRRRRRQESPTCSPPRSESHW
jgi:hypothetical protein